MSASPPAGRHEGAPARRALTDPSLRQTLLYAFQSLRLQAEPYPGMPHRIEIRAQGLEPVTFEVRITPGESITYRGELLPLQSPEIR